MRVAFSFNASLASEAWVRTPRPRTASSGCEVTVPIPVTVTVFAPPGTPAMGGHGDVATGHGRGAGRIDGAPIEPRTTPEDGADPTAVFGPDGPSGAIATMPVELPGFAFAAGAVGRAGPASDGTTTPRTSATAATIPAMATRLLMAAPLSGMDGGFDGRSRRGVPPLRG